MTIMKKPLMIVVLLAMVAGVAVADDEKVSIHGFGGWAYGITDANISRLGNEDGLWDNYDFALNINAFPSKDIRINVQLYTANDNLKQTDVIVDFAFAEWTLNDQIKIRAGKVKHPFGNYGEILKAGTLRPFYNLPRSIYEGTPVSDGYTGVGLVGSKYWDNDFGVRYHLYAGQVNVPLRVINFWSVSSMVFFGEPNDPEAETYLVIETETTNAFGGQVIIDTPLEGFNFGANFQSGDYLVGEDYINKTAYGFQSEYLTDRISLRAEWAVSDFEDIMMKEEGAYLEGAYMLTENLQFAARYDWAKFSLPGIDLFNIFPSLLKSKEIALGLNYWVNPAFVIKSSWQRMDGNRFGRPADNKIVDVLKSLTLEEETNLLLLGVQYSF